MAKRFTSTEIWEEDWFLEMPTEYKLFWYYMLSNCDHAGIYKVNLRSFCGLNGVKVSSKTALTYFNNGKQRIREVAENIWLIEDFFVFQYGEHFNINNRLHKSILGLYNKYDLNLTSIRGLKDHKNTLKDKVKDIYTDSSIENTEIQNTVESINTLREENPDEKFIIPQMCTLWYSSFKNYTKDRENDFAGMGKILQFMTRQGNLSDTTEEVNQTKVLATLRQIADEVNKEKFWINKPIKSIANNIQEFYNHIKNPINGKEHRKSNTKHELSYDKP